MGQYYTPIIKHNNKQYSFYAHQFHSGVKLMEHSYFGNYFCNQICNFLVDKPSHVIWLGDYTREGLSLNLSKAEIDKLHLFSNTNTHEKPKAELQGFDWVAEWYLVNQTQQCFVDMKWQAQLKNKDGYSINPLPLLTASSNGQGGGDYFADSGSEYVGTWCNDIIYLTQTRPEEYTEISPEFYEV